MAGSGIKGMTQVLAAMESVVERELTNEWTYGKHSLMMCALSSNFPIVHLRNPFTCSSPGGTTRNCYFVHGNVGERMALQGLQERSLADGQGQSASQPAEQLTGQPPSSDTMALLEKMIEENIEKKMIEKIEEKIEAMIEAKAVQLRTMMTTSVCVRVFFIYNMCVVNTLVVV